VQRTYPISSNPKYILATAWPKKRVKRTNLLHSLCNDAVQPCFDFDFFLWAKGDRLPINEDNNDAMVYLNADS
jgi:hypothetical protein